MPEPYTPTTEQIRTMCTYDPEYEYFRPDDPGYWRENQARFDRWLSAYTTRIREEAVAEAGETTWEFGITWDPYVTGDLQEPNSYGAATEAQAWEIGRKLAGSAQTVHVWKRPMRPAMQAVPIGPWSEIPEGENDNA